MELTIEERTHDLTHSNDELEQTITYLKQTQTQLIESEKMASLGVLVTGVAHEINTPIGIGLTGITHFMDIHEKIENTFENNNMTESMFKEFLEVSKELSVLIYSGLSKTSDLVKSFKQIAVDKTYEEKSEFNLKKAILHSILSLGDIINKNNIDISVNSKENIIIYSYPSAFSQIITNLILNTMSHAYELEKIGKIVIQLSIIEKNVVLEFKDDGKGIDKENISRIFDPFFTTNRKNGGIGLGLNIIYNIITSQLKGSIDCKSELNKGTTFIITIPLIK